MAGYRLLKIGGAYSRTIERFYRQHPGLASSPYREQFTKYIDYCIDFSDYYSRHINSLGWEAFEIIANAEPMQKQWAREHNVSFDEHHWEKQILSAQIRHFKPDVLYWGEADLHIQTFRLAVRNENPGIRLHISFKCSPVKDFNSVKDLDLMVTCTPTFVRNFRQAGLKTALLRHAFERSLIEKVGPQERAHDFTFTGSLGSSFHTGRNDLVEDLMASTPLEVWSYIKATDPGMRPRENAGILASALLKVPPQIIARLPILKTIADSARRQPVQTLKERYPGRVHEEVMGLDMFRLLARSKITLNVHIDAAGEDAGSMRMFEATGMGAMLLTDQKHDLEQMFEPGKEVVVYKSARECADLVDYYLRHDDERERIALAGQKRTLNEHTYAHRANQLVAILEPMLKK